MNEERMLQLADYVEESDWAFYQQSIYFHSCGTPACLAGHTAVLFDVPTPPIVLKPDYTMSYYREVGKFHDSCRHALDLTFAQGHALFEAHPFRDAIGIPSYRPNARDAAATLRHSVETGQIQWIKAR